MSILLVGGCPPLFRRTLLGDALPYTGVDGLTRPGGVETLVVRPNHVILCLETWLHIQTLWFADGESWYDPLARPIGYALGRVGVLLLPLAAAEAKSRVCFLYLPTCFLF